MKQFINTLIYNSNYDKNEIALLFTDLINSIEDENYQSTEELFQEIKENLKNDDLFNEVYEEYKCDIEMFVVRLENALYTLFVDGLGLCPKCGNRLTEITSKEKIDYMGSISNFNYIDGYFCDECGWKEY